METNITKSAFSIDEIVKIIENAFHEADEKKEFENTLIYSVRPEKGHVLIKPKQDFISDFVLLEERLIETFPESKYEIKLSRFIIIINKRSVM